MKHMATIVKGYGNILKKGSLFLLTILLVMGGTLLLITPLWLLATHHQAVYNVLILCLLGGGSLLLLIILPLRKALIQAESPLIWLKTRLIPRCGKILIIIPLVLIFYAMTVMISAGLAWGAGLLLIGLLYGIGYFYFVKKNNSH